MGYRFALGVPRMTAKKFDKQLNKQESYSSPPSTAEIAENEKMPMAEFFPVFLKTRLGQWLFGPCREMERVFN
jgi:hypothetical protein